MTCSIPSLNIPLMSPPKVRRIAIYTHGAIPIESWKNLGFWCMHAYRYSARLRLDDTWFELRPGLVSVFPPQCELEYRYRGPSLHTYAHFYLENHRRVETQMVPALIDLGSRFEEFIAQFDQAVAWLPTQPVRSQARLWDLLWQLTSYPSGTDTRQSGHYLLDRALEWIELRLGEPFSIGELTDDLDLSSTHLVRLFRRHLETTPVAYIHQRRAEHAKHLLIHTTLPMKSIARQIGLTDLQQFNKLLRKTLGRSPRAIRFASK